ncbi:PadR family transcriptional regulator [Mycoplasmatota bacterium]|nr:PadR family transcriptional regulator [Mycoplasmatota bacterium]
MNIQFKKGVLELCVLSILDQKDCYGYELVNNISRSFTISEGTIYPLLSRLKKEGYVTTYLEESQEGPTRKYYELSPAGRNILKDLKAEWFSFTKGVNRLLKGSEAYE